MALLEAEDSLEKQGIKKLAKKGSMTRRASNSPKLHRNEIEKNRRMSMKDLYARLAFQIPTAPSKVRPTTITNISYSSVSFPNR